MAKYRKKPVVIEAIQWTGHNISDICKFTDRDVNHLIAGGQLYIATLEGVHHASVGDFIIKGVKGEFYPCKPDIFAQTYEPADAPTIDPETLRPKGRWILEAHNERVNYRWNVTAECSECCDEKKEIWAGFFPGVPDSMAREVSLMDAKQVKLSNYCPNCGAKMEG